MVRGLQKEGYGSPGAPDGENSVDGGFDAVASHFGQDGAKVDDEGVLSRHNIQPGPIFPLNLHNIATEIGREIKQASEYQS